jgi:hypothetical protein
VPTAGPAPPSCCSQIRRRRCSLPKSQSQHRYLPGLCCAAASPRYGASFSAASPAIKRESKKKKMKEELKKDRRKKKRRVGEEKNEEKE